MRDADHLATYARTCTSLEMGVKNVSGLKSQRNLPADEQIRQRSIPPS
jgi:hypothetical protein